MSPQPTTEGDRLESLRAIVAHLLTCDRVTILGEYVLRIGRTSYAAVRYSQECDILTGCPAYDRGERSYMRHAIYVAGPLPASYRRNPGGIYTNGLAYELSGECAGRWFVACHSGDAPPIVNAQVRSGPDPMFILHRYDSLPYGEQRTMRASLDPARPECGHSACRQNWIDSGETDCVETAEDA